MKNHRFAPKTRIFAVTFVAILVVGTILYMVGNLSQNKPHPSFGVVHEIKEHSITIDAGNVNGDMILYEIEKPFLSFYQVGEEICFRKEGDSVEIALKPRTARMLEWLGVNVIILPFFLALLGVIVGISTFCFVVTNPIKWIGWVQATIFSASLIVLMFMTKSGDFDIWVALGFILFFIPLVIAFIQGIITRK